MEILITFATIIVGALVVFLIAFIATRGQKNRGNEEEVLEEEPATKKSKMKGISRESEELVASTGLKVLCFFVPLVGLAIYAGNISFNRKFASDCGKSSLIGFLIPVIIFLILCVISVILLLFNMGQNIVV